MFGSLGVLTVEKAGGGCAKSLLKIAIQSATFRAVFTFTFSGVTPRPPTVQLGENRCHLTPNHHPSRIRGPLILLQYLASAPQPRVILRICVLRCRSSCGEQVVFRSHPYRTRALSLLHTSCSLRLMIHVKLPGWPPYDANMSHTSLRHQPFPHSNFIPSRRRYAALASDASTALLSPQATQGPKKRRHLWRQLNDNDSGNSDKRQASSSAGIYF